jgi:hypothetical protein
LYVLQWLILAGIYFSQKHVRHYGTVPLTNLAILPKVRCFEISMEKLNMDSREIDRFSTASICGRDLLHLDAFHHQNVLPTLLSPTLEHQETHILHLWSNGYCGGVYHCNLVDILPAVYSAPRILGSNGISRS